jgi:hypothetical protein
MHACMHVSLPCTTPSPSGSELSRSFPHFSILHCYWIAEWLQHADSSALPELCCLENGVQLSWQVRSGTLTACHSSGTCNCDITQIPRSAMLRSAVQQAWICRRRACKSATFHSTAATAQQQQPQQHIHGPACSHTQHPVPPTSTVPSPVPAPAATALPSGRPLPPPSVPGQLPPGDHASLPGWYQRPLPPALIPFSSNRGKQLFKEALARGGGEGYFALAEQFQTQSTPSCQSVGERRVPNPSGCKC